MRPQNSVRGWGEKTVAAIKYRNSVYFVRRLGVQLSSFNPLSNEVSATPLQASLGPLHAKRCSEKKKKGCQAPLRPLTSYTGMHQDRTQYPCYDPQRVKKGCRGV